jgi:hypothetical protein
MTRRAYVRRLEPAATCRFNVVEGVYVVADYRRITKEPALGRGDTKARAWREAAKGVRARRVA